ncbi:MAG: hypothetical protein WC657_04480 [Candidatus Paceibacterota bacterium]|jgi:hypothetical protein
MAEKKQYPADFVRRAKEEYPNWPDLHKALNSGNEFVGRYLDDSSQGGISPYEIVKLIDQNKVQELRQKADQFIRRKKLYSDWYDTAQEMFYFQKV